MALVAVVVGVGIYLGLGMRDGRLRYAELVALQKSETAAGEVIAAAEFAKDRRALVLGACGALAAFCALWRRA